jgi:hypothetical protein
MMSIEVIHRLSQEIAVEAAKAGRQPIVLEPEDFEVYRATGRGVRLPNLGDHIPRGWERLPTDDWWFVDKNGCGLDYEPALTLRKFLSRLEQFNREHPDYGYAIVEEGECQVFVAPFAPKQRSRRY